MIFFKKMFLALIALIVTTEMSYTNDTAKEEFLIGDASAVTAYISGTCFIAVQVGPNAESDTVSGVWDCSTPGGKNMLEVATTAVSSKKKIKLWFKNPVLRQNGTTVNQATGIVFTNLPNSFRRI
ncbi:hypothetical protein [Bartonella sp. F02]|uniref:hypothetical protein n=1 Tax=Bartonella sp. F02 TaxID=2967262 RepID=UPI0022A98560|nr:hypothetical protein [Bartonella sp. F02]MCZ2328884.1 hypothetical protein [Bartonella sp. F02]